MYIVFDIGATNMRIATATVDSLGEIRKVPTPQDLDEVIATFTKIARELSGSSFTGAAGCIPGQIDSERGIYDANNRKHWTGRHFDIELSKALGVPVQIANDCAVIALGENMSGAGKGSRNMTYVTVSTGVGAGHVQDGKILPLDGFYFGHESVDGEELESRISGTAVTRKFGIHPKDLDSLEERNKLANIFARGLVKLIELWKPDTIVVGGSMIIGVNPIPLKQVEVSLAGLVSAEQMPAIKMAALGDDGGLHGARILAQSQ